MKVSALEVLAVEEFYSRDGYRVEFNSDRWRLNKDVAIPISKLKPYLQGRDDSVRRVLEFYARTASPSYTEAAYKVVLKYCREMEGSELFSVASLISYRSTLTTKTEWQMGGLRTVIRRWSKMGLPGIADEVLLLLNKWVLKGGEKGRVVQSMCPESGPLTDIELQAVSAAVIDAFAEQRLSLADTCIAMILAMTGRRPVQIAALKLKDLVSPMPGSYGINFPRAKQRDSPWRSAFKCFYIVEDLWLLLQQQAEAVRSAFSEQSGEMLSIQMVRELPLFPVTHSLSGFSDVEELLRSDRLHIPSSHVGGVMLHVARVLAVFSERTGEPLHLNPYRFRYTLGTNLAREGKGEYIIAEALDHTDTQNVGMYVKNIPDIVECLDKAVALQLAPYAQAFRGVLVRSELEARRGNDPSSRIFTGQSHVGTCGSYGFCGAAAPVACYTCGHFQPWLAGPHEEVLELLIQERKRVHGNCGDLKIASANDRLIFAVGDVINRCREIRDEVESV